MRNLEELRKRIAERADHTFPQGTPYWRAVCISGALMALIEDLKLDQLVEPRDAPLWFLEIARVRMPTEGEMLTVVQELVEGVQS